MRLAVFAAAAAVLAAATALPAAAQQERAVFDVSVAGITAGTLTLVGTERGGTYEVQGAGRSRGVVAALTTVSVDAAANGRVDGNRYRPSGYTEVVQDRDGTSRKRIRYNGGGVPQVTEDPPEDDREPYHADPGGQGGTLDPLTIVWALFRDRPRDLVCSLDAATYDGRERSRVRLGGAREEGDRILCAGIYTREAGYSDKEMAEQRRWDFSMTYRPAGGDVWAVEEVTVPMRYGTMRFRRQ